MKETALKDILDQAGERRITLLFAARDQTCNHAVVLQKHFTTVGKCLVILLHSFLLIESANRNVDVPSLWLDCDVGLA